MMEKLFIEAVRTGLLAGVVILVLALAAPRLRKRYAAQWFCLAWGLLALRLLVCIPAALPAGAAPVQLQLPAALAQPVEYQAAPAEQGQAGGQGPALVQPAPQGQPPVAPDIPETPEKASPWLPSPLWLAAAVWLAGAATLLLCTALRWLLWRRAIWRWNRPVEDAKMQVMLEMARLEVGLSRPVRLVANSRVESPMVTGLLRPVLLLPAGAKAGPALEMVLLHELTHLRRGDLWLKLLARLAACLQWWNPAAWVLCRQLGRDIEAACDAAVVKGRSLEWRAGYGRVLIQAGAMARGGRAPKVDSLPLTSCFSTGGQGMKARLDALFEAEGLRRGRALLAVLATGLVLAGTLVACSLPGAGGPSEADGPPAGPDEPVLADSSGRVWEAEDESTGPEGQPAAGGQNPGSALLLGDALCQGFEAYNIELGSIKAYGYQGGAPGNALDDSALAGASSPELGPMGLLRQEQPATLFLSYGLTMLPDHEDESILADYAALLDDLQASFEGMAVQILSVTPVRQAEGGNPALTPQRVAGLNGKLAALAEERGLAFVDLDPILAEAPGTLKADYAAADGYHLQPAAYQAWADHLTQLAG